jgi:hypothetical protein
MTAPVTRDARGRLLPGASLNPGGRPATLEPVRALLRQHTEQFVTALVDLLSSKDDSVRLAAVKEYFDRLCGKPVAVTEAAVRTQSVDLTAAIREMYLKAVSIPLAPTIDAEPSATVLPPSHDGNDATDDREPW